MRFTLLYITFLSGLLLAGCQQQEGVEAKKSQLKDYQSEAKTLQSKITALEEEIAREDPSFKAGNANATLVTLESVRPQAFRHYISVSGNVASDRNVSINAEASAEVERVRVKKGDSVRKGQLLITQDADMIQKNIAELKTSLELASTKAERQAALWDKKIGSEIQYLETKNAKESLERKLASANAQLENYRVVAPFSGTIDDVFIKEGEVTIPGTPMLRLVSLQDMYILADVSESYLGEFEQGDSVTVQFPSLKKTLESTINSVGQVINENNRTFEVQVNLSKDQSLLRPNLLAVLQIKDFQKENAIVIPTNLIQEDNQGSYVFVVTGEQEKLTAKKVRVERGTTYDNQTMITSGLSANDKLIKDGAREVADGASVKVAEQTADNSVLPN